MICFDTNTPTSGNSISLNRDALCKGENMNEATYAYLPKKIMLKPGELKMVQFSLDKTYKKGKLSRYSSV